MEFTVVNEFLAKICAQLFRLLLQLFEVFLLRLLQLFAMLLLLGGKLLAVLLLGVGGELALVRLAALSALGCGREAAREACEDSDIALLSRSQGWHTGLPGLTHKVQGLPHKEHAPRGDAQGCTGLPRKDVGG